MLDFGLTPHEFRERCLDKQPHLQKAAMRGQPFAWHELDGVLHQIEPVAPIFQLFNGALVAEEQYTDVVAALGAARRRLNKRRFFEQLRGGATLVVNGFENYSATALRLGAAVARFCGWQTVGNAYLSVGGSGTFGKHWDTHDVFAIQLIGRKRWQVFEPTFPLPLGIHRSENSGQLCPSTPAIDCVLEVGDLLYVPRGWWHCALPFNEPSLHLSVGAYGPTMHDYVTWACATHLPTILAARRSMTAAIDGRDLESVLQALRDVVVADATRAAFEQALAGAERVRSEFDTELFLSAGADGLKRGAIVRLNSARSADPKRAELLVNGAWLRLHPTSRSIVAALAASALRIEELYEQLAHERPDAIRGAVLDLAQHEIVTIERKAGEREPPR
jgi:ribosomal protein L16 Arg81 hydroxylase